MPIFPNSEHELVELCAQVLCGLKESQKEFSRARELEPRVRETWSAYRNAKETQRQKRREYTKATELKNEFISALAPLLKELLALAEEDSRENPKDLKALGWGPPKKRGRPPKKPPERPGSPQGLAAASEMEGGDRVRLTWKAAAGKGGEPTHFEVLRKTGAKKEWRIVGTLPASPGGETQSMVMDGEPLDTPLVYKVIAVNRWGRSESSKEAALALSSDPAS